MTTTKSNQLIQKAPVKYLSASDKTQHTTGNGPKPNQTKLIQQALASDVSASDKIQNTTNNLQNQARQNWSQRLLWVMFLLQTKYKTRLVIDQTKTRPIYTNCSREIFVASNIQTKYKTRLVIDTNQIRPNWCNMLMWGMLLLQTKYKTRPVID